MTGALWLPLLWMLIICTRAVTEWLGLFGVQMGGISLEEGSPLDAFFYYALIAAGIYVLNKRHVRLSEVIRDNQWLTIFFIYCFLAVLWSDFPLVSLKRWTKVIGHFVMILILFTEPDPREAVIRLMKRCAYVVVPVSILFIKYYPEWGRGFSKWTGQGYNCGITGGKNALGYDCLILGYFFFWYLLQTWRTERGRFRRHELTLIFGLLFGIWWLLSIADSSTSLMSFLLAVATVLVLGLGFVNKKLIGTYIVIGVVAIIIAESTFGVTDYVLSFLHRDATLTERTHLWDTLFRVKINPIIGTGYESFWLGERREKIWIEQPWRPNEAHNGYLETYLTLGLAGLSILMGLIGATYFKTRRELLRDFEWGRFRVGFLVATVFYNWTESAFKGLHPVWFVFCLIALDYRAFRSTEIEASSEVESGKEHELAFNW